MTQQTTNSTANVVLTVLKSIFSIFFFFFFLGSLTDRSYLSAFIFLLGAILIFPLLTNFWRSKIPFLKNKIIKAGLLLVLFIVGIVANSNIIKSNPDFSKSEDSVTARKPKKIIEEKKDNDEKKEKIVKEVTPEDAEAMKRERAILEKERLAKEEKAKMKKIMGNGDFWKNYDPIVKQRIYTLIVNEDCKRLQNEFNTAADMMDKKQKVGIGASKELALISFIDEKLRKLDCY